MTTFYAQPYAIGWSGFYFTSLEDYQTKEAAHGCEEFELQFIDGDLLDAKLFEAAGINQANLPLWADLEALEDDHKRAVLWLMADRGCTPEQALEQAEEVSFSTGSITDYAWQFAEECLGLNDWPETAQRYWDAESYARDLQLGGDIDTIEIDGIQYIITNANSF